MKGFLFDIETGQDKELLSRAQALIGQTREFDLKHPESGKYYIISSQPDYHVEIVLQDSGMAKAKCQCAVFKRTSKCRHALAALLILRDEVTNDRKSRKKQGRILVDEVVRKIGVKELRSFIAEYAASHASLRAELLANYLFLLNNPDYHQLFQDLAPIDKYGNIRLNRNNVKSIRSVTSTLINRSGKLIQTQSWAEALAILEAVISHLHRLHAKATAYLEQWMTELKNAYKHFNIICRQPLPPRLQVRINQLALEVSGRDSYFFPAGFEPLLKMAEPFLLEKKSRKEALEIAVEKVKDDHPQSWYWIQLVVHWMRIWNMHVPEPQIEKNIERNAEEILRHLEKRGEFEDVLYVISMLEKKNALHKNETVLRAAFWSARNLGWIEEKLRFAKDLAISFFDHEAWLDIFAHDKEAAVEILDEVKEKYPEGKNLSANHFLLKSWNIAGDHASMIKRMETVQDLELWMEFDHLLKNDFKRELTVMYAGHIRSIFNEYGGVIARQKLNNIFSHLKELDLYTAVMEEIKAGEKTRMMSGGKPVIQGFIFDLDGVIVDTAIHHFQAWKKIFKQLGADITEDDDHHTRGAGRMESLEYLLEKYRIRLSEEEKIEWAARKNEVYLSSIENITPADLLPGTLAFLEASRELGLKIALGSASKNALTVLEKLGVSHYFDAIIDGNQIKASKPDPEIFIKACEALDLDPSATVVFEDAPKGIQSALAAGCKAVGIGDSTTLREADIVIPGLDHFTPKQMIESLA